MPGLPGWDAAELAVGEAVNEWRYSTQSIQYVLLPLLQPIPTFRRLSSSPCPAPYKKRSSIAILDVYAAGRGRVLRSATLRLSRS
jgi:hypothetical protein